MNKIYTTNFLALFFTVLGSFSPIYGKELFLIGIFSLSGSLTNWIAIHMLFEKVPLFYGSGVIPNKFEEFKRGIKKLIIHEFFDDQNIEKFFKKNKFNFDKIIDQTGEEKIFSNLIEAIKESSLGSMLDIIGGEKALSALKEPILRRIKETFYSFQNKSTEQSLIINYQKDIELLIDEKMKTLEPENVKIIIENMIKNHLGWLVVWGALFGGMIGLVYSVIRI